MERPIRLLIADDHPPTRAGVRAALDGEGFEVCAEVGDAPAAVEAARAERPDVCLLDIHMPGNGIAAAARITQAVPETAVVMLTVSRNDDDLFDALRVGAIGYLLKDMEADRLAQALRDVLAGEAVLSRGLLARVMEEFRSRGRHVRLPLSGRRSAQLTSREWETLDLLRQGLTTKQIADRLFVAPVTVRTHIAAVLRKLRVPDREAAIRLLEERDDRR
jgi:DNA-binding NarL/FixJ family response regulator